MMEADEFREALERLDLTHHTAAERLGMGRHGWQSVRKWARGEQDIPGPVGVALRLLLERQWHAVPVCGGGGVLPTRIPGVVEYAFYLQAEWPNALGEQPDDLIGRRVRQGEQEFEVIAREGDRFICGPPLF